MRRVSAAAVLVVASACGSVRAGPDAPAPAVELTGTRGAPTEIPTSSELEEVARLEDARTLGNGRLLEFLAVDRDTRVRARAATALGRLPYPRFGPEVTEALARALEDPAIEVRLAAAFALGVRADPASAGTLLAYRNDPDARMRATVVEAASKVGDARVHSQLALALRDPDLSVRMEAAVATARWDTAETSAAEVDRALLDTLSPYRITRTTAPKSAVEAELVWRILWALGRRKSEVGRGAFLEYAHSRIPLERLFALRGLAQLTPDPAAVDAAVQALVGADATDDWRVAYEATVALGRHARNDERGELPAPVQQALEKAVEHSSAHVRAGAMDALGNLGDGRTVLALLQRGRLDLSVSVRAASLKARVRVASGDDALEVLQSGARDEDPVVRAAAADAAGNLSDSRAAEVLASLARDPSKFVATRAVERLGKHPSSAVRAQLHGFLEHADNGVRLAAVLALEAMPAPEDVTALTATFSSAQGDVGAEVAFNALEVLAAIATDDARRVVESAQSDARPHVRAVAKELVRKLGGVPSTEESPFIPDRSVPVPGTDTPAWRFNPLVELRTSRGTMLFELFPAETPIHVHNFLVLVERGDYTRLTFHRVVPDFVVQGGDYRGDGNGARPWEGEALRAEFTPRKSTRGSLGMPRNEDPDSGGSQFFVTHLPTPHLDGRYTFFGELRSGGDVLDRLEVGDRIVGARILH